MENQRKAFRIEYRAKDMPSVDINDKKYPIIDISTSGLKIWSSNDFHDVHSIEGRIHLHTGELKFRGYIIRVNKRSNCTAINIYPELSGGSLNKERNYLKNEKGYII
jgi:hypothetical protein